MTHPAIRVERLSKNYRLGQSWGDSRQTFREALVGAARGLGRRFTTWSRKRPAPTFWALKDVSFEIPRGQVLGVIGRNGAGKSTLLKIIARITEPTAGRIEIRGRVASLLEVGTGFHSELTGRENIWLSGAILGMSGREVARKFDAIVAFSEIERFLDTPVKRYSSGMYVRLAFAVAAHLQTEVLLVDEVLAVGDAKFQEKCLRKMNEVGQSGCTVLFVSHNMPTILSLCERVIWLAEGRLHAEGPPQGLIHRYLTAQTDVSGGVVDLRDCRGRRGFSTPIAKTLTIRAADGTVTDKVPMASRFRIEVSFASETPIVQPVFDVWLTTLTGLQVYSVSSAYVRDPDFPDQVRRGTFCCQLDGLPVNQGHYQVGFLISDGGTSIDWVDYAAKLEFLPIDYFGSGKLARQEHSVIAWPARWSFQPPDPDGSHDG